MAVAALLVDFAAEQLLSAVAAEAAARVARRFMAPPRGAPACACGQAAVGAEPTLTLISTVDERAEPSSAALTVLSSTPGRVRLRVDGMRGSPSIVRLVEDAAKRIVGVRTAKGSHRTGSLLVSYDHVTATMADVRSAIEAALSTAATTRR
jgi:hypothetical protein